MSTDDRDDLGPLEPGLDKLFRVLTSGPSRDELAGEQDAVTMFRTARQSAGPPRPATTQRAERRARQRNWGIRRTIAVATVAFVAGFAAAAYAEVLPAPVQHVAYKVLGFAGVPDAPAQHNQPQSGRTSPASAPAGSGSSQSATGRSSSPASSPSPSRSRTSSPRPGSSTSTAPPPPPQLSAAASQSQIAAGGSVTITGSATRHGTGARGVSVTLQELTARHRVWTTVTQGKTGRNGQVALTVSDLTVNAGFRVTAAGSVPSAPVLVTVVPQVTASVLTRPSGRRAVIKVVCLYAQPGNVVVLEVYRAGVWVPVRAHRIGGLLKTGFVVKVPLTKTRTLQVVLRATRLHAKAVSNEVTVGPRV